VGVDRLTMRLVGEELGLSSVAAYRHVRNRDHLLEMAADVVLQRVIDKAPKTGGWEERLRAVLHLLRVECSPYPWVGPYLAMREAEQHRIPPDSPTLGILRDAGLSDDEALLHLSFVNAFVIGAMLRTAPQPPSSARNRRRDDVIRAWDYGADMLILGIRALLASRSAAT
jgi:AcrR family transcriptional regulator